MAAAADARPRFRQDLLAEALEDGGTRFIDVMDPDSGHLFRFFEVEYSIACAMDGERDIAGIVKWAQDELGVTPSPAEVRSVIATLGNLGFLGAEAIPAAVGEPAAAAGAAMARIPLKRTPASGVTVNPESAVAPAAAARDPRRDDDLAPGIVVGKAERTAAKPAASVELGGAGSTARPAVTELPATEDVGLGAAGSTGFVDDGRPAIIEDIALGASGVGDAAPKVEDSIPEPPRDMSLDLSDHIAVRPDDVKEAVRASKVMSAVEVPPELLAALENEKPAADARTDATKAEAAKAADAAAAKAAAEKAAADARAAADVKAAAEAAKAAKAAAAKAQTTEKVAKPAIELPKQPPPGDAAKMPTATPARTSRALIALLVFVVVAAGAYAMWRLVLDKSGGGDKRAAVQPIKPEPPPPPPPKITLVPEPQTPVTVTATVKGNVDKVTAETSVKPGDWIISLVGHAAPEQTIKDLTPQRDKVDKDIATAEANNDPAKMATAQKLKDTLDAKLQAANAELDKYVVRAPVAGALVVDAKIKPGLMVADNQSVATINPPTLMTAKFPLPPDVQQEPAKVKMKDVTKNDVDVVCSVRLRDQPADTSAPTGSSNQPILNIACPGDGLDAGDEVKFVEVATDDIDMDTGSAAGSAAPEATGSAAAGSATGSASVSRPVGSSSASATPATSRVPTPAPAAPTPTASPAVHQVRLITAGRVPQNIRANLAANPAAANGSASAPTQPPAPAPPAPADPAKP